MWSLLETFNRNTISRGMKIKLFVTCLIVLLLCLSLDSCKQALTQEEGGDNIEVSNSGNDNKEAETDSLTDATTDSKIKAERMKKEDAIHRKTKAQYVIY